MTLEAPFGVPVGLAVAQEVEISLRDRHRRALLPRLSAYHPARRNAATDTARQVLMSSSDFCISPAIFATLAFAAKV